MGQEVDVRGGGLAPFLFFHDCIFSSPVAEAEPFACNRPSYALQRMPNREVSYLLRNLALKFPGRGEGHQPSTILGTQNVFNDRYQTCSFRVIFCMSVGRKCPFSSVLAKNMIHKIIFPSMGSECHFRLEKM